MQECLTCWSCDQVYSQQDDEARVRAVLLQSTRNWATTSVSRLIPLSSHVELGPRIIQSVDGNVRGFRCVNFHLFFFFFEIFWDLRRRRRGSASTRARDQNWNVYGLKKSPLTVEKKREAPPSDCSGLVLKGGAQPSFQPSDCTLGTKRIEGLCLFSHTPASPDRYRPTTVTRDFHAVLIFDQRAELCSSFAEKGLLLRWTPCYVAQRLSPSCRHADKDLHDEVAGTREAPENFAQHDDPDRAADHHRRAKSREIKDAGAIVKVTWNG